MDISLISEKRTIVVKIQADLDHHLASQIRKSVDAKVKGSNAVNIVFDFSEVDFMDSSGIGMLMGRYKITNILGGRVIIFGLKKQVKRIIDMAGIDKIINICDTYDTAINLVWLERIVIKWKI